jgi:hypothetical protein
LPISNLISVQSPISRILFARYSEHIAVGGGAREGLQHHRSSREREPKRPIRPGPPHCITTTMQLIANKLAEYELFLFP